jgi:hypothetical protein
MFDLNNQSQNPIVFNNRDSFEVRQNYSYTLGFIYGVLLYIFVDGFFKIDSSSSNDTWRSDFFHKFIPLLTVVSLLVPFFLTSTSPRRHNYLGLGENGITRDSDVYPSSFSYFKNSCKGLGYGILWGIGSAHALSFISNQSIINEPAKLAFTELSASGLLFPAYEFTRRHRQDNFGAVRVLEVSEESGDEDDEPQNSPSNLV